MIDLELGLDLHYGLKEEFGRRPDWPSGVHAAETLLATTGAHLGREGILAFLRCADMANARFERLDTPGARYRHFLGVARVVFPQLNDSETVDLLWPVLAAIVDLVCPEDRGRFLVAALAGLEESEEVGV